LRPYKYIRKFLGNVGLLEIYTTFERYFIIFQAKNVAEAKTSKHPATFSASGTGDISNINFFLFFGIIAQYESVRIKSKAALKPNKKYVALCRYFDGFWFLFLLFFNGQHLNVQNN
jgi:hypothetical protein